MDKNSLLAKAKSNPFFSSSPNPNEPASPASWERSSPNNPPQNGPKKKGESGGRLRVGFAGAHKKDDNKLGKQTESSSLERCDSEPLLGEQNQVALARFLEHAEMDGRLKPHCKRFWSNTRKMDIWARKLRASHRRTLRERYGIEQTYLKQLENIAHGGFEWLPIESEYFWLQRQLKEELLRRSFGDLIHAQEMDTKRKTNSTARLLAEFRKTNTKNWSQSLEQSFNSTRDSIRGNARTTGGGFPHTHWGSVTLSKMLHDSSHSHYLRKSAESEAQRGNSSRPSSAPPRGRSSSALSSLNSSIQMTKQSLVRQDLADIHPEDIHGLEVGIADRLLDEYKGDVSSWRLARNAFLEQKVEKEREQFALIDAMEQRNRSKKEHQKEIEIHSNRLRSWLKARESKSCTAGVSDKPFSFTEGSNRRRKKDTNPALTTYSGGPQNCWRSLITVDIKNEAATKIQRMWLKLRGHRTLSRALAELRIRRQLELKREAELRQVDLQKEAKKKARETVLLKEESERYARGEIQNNQDAALIHCVRTSEGKECVINLRRLKILQSPIRDSIMIKILRIIAERKDNLVIQEIHQAIISWKGKQYLDGLIAKAEEAIMSAETLKKKI